MAQRHDYAVVTGGSSGIGKAVVLALLARDLHVAVLDLTPLPDDLDSSDGRLSWLQTDVTDEAQVAASFAELARRNGPPAHLAVVHGIRGEYRPATELDIATFRNVLDNHIGGTFRVAREFTRRRLESSGQLGAGAIVTVSSTTAFGGWDHQADYGTAKASVAHLTKTLAVEWAPHGVRVNSVAPGHTNTPMVQQMIDEGYDLTVTRQRIPLARLAEPEEIATTMEHLLLDATYVTGTCVPVDGGWTAVGR